MMILLAIGLVFGLFLFGGFGGDGQQVEQEPTIVATVGTHGVSLESIERMYDAATQAADAQEEGLSPEAMARNYGESLYTAVNRAAILELADRKGIKLSEDDVLVAAEREFNQEMEYRKSVYAMLGRLKPDSSEADFRKVLREMTGKDYEDQKKEYFDRIKEGLNSPSRRDETLTPSVGQALMDRYQKVTTVTDEQLKKGFDTWVAKRIVLKPIKHMGEALEIKVGKIRDEVKRGLSFEAAMNKYSDDDAAKGKSKSESTIDIARSNVDHDVNLKPFLSLKPGDISPVLRTSDGPAIYKVVKFQSKVPADFTLKKEDFRKTRIAEIGLANLQKDLRELAKPEAISWESPGLKALYEWQVATTDPETASNRQKLEDALKKVFSEGTKAVEESTDIAGTRPAVLAQYAAFQQLYREASDSEKKALDKDRAKALENILELTENYDLRIELAKLKIAAKKGDEALENLQSAADTIFSYNENGMGRYKQVVDLRNRLEKQKLAEKADLQKIDKALAQWRVDMAEKLVGDADTNQDYSESGKKTYDDIEKMVAKLKSAGLISAEKVAEIEKLQKKWREEKAKEDKREAEAKKQAEEEAKKQKAEAEKAKKANTAKPPTTPTSGGNPLTGAGKG